MDLQDYSIQNIQLHPDTSHNFPQGTPSHIDIWRDELILFILNDKHHELWSLSLTTFQWHFIRSIFETDGSQFSLFSISPLTGRAYIYCPSTVYRRNDSLSSFDFCIPSLECLCRRALV
jgi:hypothetical protein